MRSIFVFALLGAACAHAVPRDQLYDHFIQNHPGIQAARLRLEQSLFRARSISQNHPANISLEAEQWGGDAPGLDRSEWTLAYAREIQRFPERRTRASLRTQTLDLAELELELQIRQWTQTWDQRGREYWSAKQRLLLERRALKQAEAFLQMARQRVAAGLTTGLEVTKAFTMEARARQKVQSLEVELRSCRSILLELSCWPDPEAEVEIDLSPPSEIPPLEEILQQGRDSLAARISRLSSEVAIQMARLEAGEARGRPGITLGTRHEEESGDLTFLAGFEMPLAFKGKSGSLQEVAEREEHIQELEVRRLALDRDILIRALHHRILEAKSNLEHQEKVLIPLLEQNQGDAMKSYEEGVIPYLEMLDAQAELKDSRREALNLALEFHSLWADLSAICGSFLSHPTGGHP